MLYPLSYDGGTAKSLVSDLRRGFFGCVLALNLPVTSSADIIEGSIYEHAQAGEPLRLTLRQLAIGEIEVAPGAVVPVCENPSVVA